MVDLSMVICVFMPICLISPAFYAFTIKISPAFYKILLNMLDYQIFIVSLQKIINRGHNYEIFK